VINPPGRLSSTLRRWPLLPLLLVVAINATSFVLFARVGGLVGAETGSDGYQEIAESLNKGHGFVFSPGEPSTMMLGYMKREPVYPLWLWGILAVTGSLTPLMLGLFQTGLCLVACCLVDRLGAEVFDGQTARLASYIYAVHPISFWYTTRFASELIAVPVLLLCLIVIHRFLTAATLSKALQTGLLIGIAALTKSAYVILLPLVLVFAAIRSRQRIEHFVLSALIVVCSFASLHSLWILRNYAISGEFVPFTTMNGVTFFLGNKIVEDFDVRKQTAGTGPDRWASDLYNSTQTDIATRQPGMSLPKLEAQTDSRLRASISEFVVARPWFIARKIAEGMVFIWFLSDTTAKSLGWAAFQAPLVILAAIGVYRQRRWSLSKQFLLSFVMVFLLAYVVVSPIARYATPVAPVVILFASFGLIRLLNSTAPAEGRP
jgi:4-amino-4-deoxy-L-arabinose transferase-like glycosyltransferase